MEGSSESSTGARIHLTDTSTTTTKYTSTYYTPKISSTGDKLTLKFVLSSTDSLGRNTDKDTVTIVVKHDPSVSSKVDSPSSTNHNDNKDRTSSRVEGNGYSNND